MGDMPFSGSPGIRLNRKTPDSVFTSRSPRSMSSTCWANITRASAIMFDMGPLLPAFLAWVRRRPIRLLWVFSAVSMLRNWLAM